MSESNSGDGAAGTAVQGDGHRRFKPVRTLILVLLLLDVIGIGLTEFAQRYSHWYWLAMVVLTGVACAFIARFGSSSAELNTVRKIRMEVLFWLGVLVAVNLVYFMYGAGRLDSENTGLVILLLLALSTFLAGLRLGWQLCLLGGLLAVALVFATYLEEYLWLVLLVGLGAGTVMYVRLRQRGTPEAGVTTRP